MDNKYSREEIIEKINYHKEMMNIEMCPYKKMYWINIITYEITKLLNGVDERINNKESEFRNIQKEFTYEELAKYDGSMGKPAYVAVNGVVYDVSNNAAWGGGTHFGLYAGKDLSKEFKDCHMNKLELAKKLPVVGKIKNI